MPTEFTRAPMLIGVFIVSLLVVLFTTLRPSQALVSTWLPRQSIAVAAAAPAPAGPAPIMGDAQAISLDALPSTSSVPISIDGDVGFNVLSALDARGGALRNVTIRPGETWSFNASVGSPAHVEIRTVGGVPGGGWCDLASRYVQAARPLLPPNAVQFVNHVTTSGIRLADVADDDAVSIWNIDGQAGSAGQSQDLQITNTLAVPLHFQVVAQSNHQIVVQATTSSS